MFMLPRVDGWTACWGVRSLRYALLCGYSIAHILFVCMYVCMYICMCVGPGGVVVCALGS